MKDNNRDFGLKLTSMEIQDDSGKTHSITYQGQGQGTKPFKQLSKEDQDKIKEIVYLTDKFYMGEAAYYELTLASGGDGLPRSFQVRQSKNHLNELIHIGRTPGQQKELNLTFRGNFKTH